MARQSDRAAAKTWLGELERIADERGFRATRWGGSCGFPLLGLQRQGLPHAPRVYVSAGIHGDEPAGPFAVERLLQLDLLDPRASWTICPLLNPAGWVAGTRETPDGFDLNRDYRAVRSPEVAAHRTWLERIGPHDLYLSFHEDWEATGFYLYEINTLPGRRPLAPGILEAVAKVMPIEPENCIDQHTVCAPGYISHPPEPDDPEGWPEAIFHSRLYPHLSYTFETPSTGSMERRIDAHVVAARTALEAFWPGWERERRAEQRQVAGPSGDSAG